MSSRYTTQFDENILPKIKENTLSYLESSSRPLAPDLNMKSKMWTTLDLRSSLCPFCQL